jgi:signal transduction histidine kinase/phage shock protein PspC (stress-responsive transcriptional regulator)
MPCEHGNVVTSLPPPSPPPAPPHQTAGTDRSRRRRRGEGLPPRSVDDQVLFGVAAGIAESRGFDPLLVRLLFVALTAFSGIGIALYVLGVVFMPAPAGAPDRGLRSSGAVMHRFARHNGQRVVGVILIVAGCGWLLSRARWLIGFGALWPLAVAGAGLVVAWSGSGAEDRARWLQRAAALPGNPARLLEGGRLVLVRVLVGAVLVLAGVSAFLASRRGLGSFGHVLLAVIVTAGGLAVLLGPWVLRLWRDLSSERRERIRSEERAEMAAHLHDSVLQTLALVQRNSGTPRELAALARRQERELRQWLYTEREAHGLAATSFHERLQQICADVEDRYDVSVDLVVVGDTGLDERVEALLAATGEAVVNAAKHAGMADVAVYAEVEGERIEVFVRDRGRGFDPAAVAPDRHGIRDSIKGRLERHGGRAVVTSTPGEGAEITLELPT